ncbi:thioester domain-containing protein [Marinactinospora thermotolerans]|uniref:thioester domain-containing protein n=1 Tax=Marinactinospora thermotolerans TaxID=531310 RepID=UPI003D89BA28
MPSITSIARRALAALTTAVLLGWGPALPVEAESTGIARVDRNGEAGTTVHLAGQNGAAASTTLFNLRVDDDSFVRAYCADLSTSVDPRAAYVEADWEEYPEPREFVDNAERVHRVILSSYPRVGLEELRRRTGLVTLTPPQAIAATQAAVWHYSNGVDLRVGVLSGNAPEVEALYAHLIEVADRGGAAEPPASLEVSPRQVRGETGAPLGPLTVRTTSESPVGLRVNGAPSANLVDPSGNPVTEVRADGEVLLQPDASAPEGTATLYATSDNATVEAGRLFVGKDGVKTQALITAESVEGVSASVSATVSWTPASVPTPSAEASPPAAEPSPSPSSSAPSPAPSEGGSPTASAPSGPVVIAEDKRPENDLAFTGTWAGTIVITGLVLLAIGGLAMFLTRRRRR